MSQIIVTSQREGFRRAGIAFSTAGTALDTDSLSEAQLAAIRADPGLSVADADAEADAEAAPTAKAPAKAGKK